MRFSTGSLHAVLQAHLPSAAIGLCVAVSGGADSACLLAALMPPSGPRFHNLTVRAVHIDHGLQPAASGLREACERLCRRLGVPLKVIPIAVECSAGESLEAAARDARYRALGLDLSPGECLLTAHHSQDQAETVLLQLLRGAGIKGLSAMPVRRPLCAGWHLRPLLEVAQRDLREFGRKAGIAAVSDPMNFDRRFDRAYLRHEVWPLIEARWPGVATVLSRSAQHLAEAQELLDQSAAFALQRLRDGATLSVPALRALSTVEQLNALRHWLSRSGVQSPSTARLREALRQVMAANADHLPVVAWGDHALRRYRDRVFLTTARPPCIGARCQWRIVEGATLDLGAALGTLHWSPRRGGLDPARLPDTLEVRRRRGGEALRPQPRARTQSVQRLCQSRGVLPWMRNALPMVYAGGDLIAVGDLWQDARWCVAPGQAGFCCEWLNAPILV